MAANFGLTPSAAHDGVLDYTTVAHAKIYSEAIKPVEPAFDCTAGGLKVFLSRIADKQQDTDGRPSLKSLKTSLIQMMI